MSDQHHFLYGLSKRPWGASRYLTSLQAIADALERQDERLEAFAPGFINSEKKSQDPGNPGGMDALTGSPAISGGPHPELRSREGRLKGGSPPDPL
jgi:hypothetical protein